MFFLKESEGNGIGECGQHIRDWLRQHDGINTPAQNRRQDIDQGISKMTLR